MKARAFHPMPAIDHEAGGPLSVLVRAVMWATRLWGERADRARTQLMSRGRRRR